jgi:hypothetical protein
MKSGEFPPSGQSSRPPVAASRPDRPAREKARQQDHRGASARPLFLFKKRSSSALVKVFGALTVMYDAI